MNFRQKRESFRKRFNIQLNQINPDIEFKRFKQRILNIYKDIDLHVPKEEVIQFCAWIARPTVFKYFGNIVVGRNIYDSLKEEDKKNEFLLLLEVILHLPIQTKHDAGEIIFSRKHLFLKTREAFDVSEINTSITENSDGIIIFPKEEQFLGEGLVENVLVFLDQKSQKHFIEALKFYEQKLFIKSAESIRRCLEEFLRFKLNNLKGLNSNINELNSFLKQKIPSHMNSICNRIFNHLDQYFNEHSKHNDGEIDEAENEYLLYQSGLLMRYIDKVAKRK